MAIADHRAVAMTHHQVFGRARGRKMDLFNAIFSPVSPLAIQ
jgi:hypothetical protein